MQGNRNGASGQISPLLYIKQSHPSDILKNLVKNFIEWLEIVVLLHDSFLLNADFGRKSGRF